MAIPQSLVWMIMAVTAQQNLAVVDGDPAFYRVDTRTPAHELGPGVAADAVNKRFEDGRAWPRLCVEREPWGLPAANLIPQGSEYVGLPHAKPYFNLSAIVKPDTEYTIIFGADEGGVNLEFLSLDIVSGGPGSMARFTTGEDVSNCSLSSNGAGESVTAILFASARPNDCAFVRFNDPEGFDVTVVVTDEWRPEDGGRGRVWLIQSGNAPKGVPLNGQDVWGEARLVPCFNGLVLLRHGNERHYFGAAAAAANQIQLNCAANWVDRDQVFLWGDVSQDSAFIGGAPLALMNIAYVQVVAGNKCELYADYALTQQYTWDSAVGRFYLERQAAAPGFYGNGAPPLLAQPNALGATLWEVGFLPVPVKLQVTNTVTTTGIWTVPNHRLTPGDKVTLAAMPAGHTPANGDYYAYPVNDHQLQLYDTQANAMLAANGSTAGLEVISDAGENLPTLVKGGASSLPMPPAREGFYTETNQLVLVTGANNINISDPNDPLHYTPYQNSLTANLGESDAVVAVSTFQAADCLVFLKQNSVLALYNFAEGAAQWALRSVTREYGCAAALSVRQWGNNLLFLSRRGLDRVTLSAFGVILPVEKPVSYNVKKYTDLIDWTAAGQAVVETWNNRLFLAAPARGQQGAKVNNLVLVLNYLNSEPQKEVWGWEGLWTGAALQVYGFAPCDVYGENRLLFCDYNGQVNWLGDGWLDLGLTPIADSLTTRLYGGADKQRKKWLKGLLVWDTCGPKLGVTAVSPGYNELQTLLTDLVYDRTLYLDGRAGVYDPATQQPPFKTPGRADYSLAGPGELIGGQPDAHQNIAETVRMRVDDWGLQLVITNKTGSCRLVSVEVEGRRGPKAGSRTV